MKYQDSQQNINQSETGTGDKKLSFELYVKSFSLKITVKPNLII